MVTDLRMVPSPSLITMEGDGYYSEPYDADMSLPELLGIDDADFMLLGSDNLTRGDIVYLNSKYPEYMGIWPILAKIGKAVATAVPNIVKAVKKRRAARKEKSKESAAAEQQRKLQAALQQQAAKKAADKKALQKKLLMIGIPVGVLGLFLILDTPRDRRGSYPNGGRYAVRGR